MGLFPAFMKGRSSYEHFGFIALCICSTVLVFAALGSETARMFIVAQYQVPGSTELYYRGVADIAYIMFWFLALAPLKYFVKSYVFAILAYKVFNIKPQNIQRFVEEFWKFAYYTVFFSWGMVQIYEEPWWRNILNCYIGYPHLEWRWGMKVLYMIETAFWMETLIEEHLEGQNKKDHFAWMLHHVIAIFFLLASMYCHLWRLGSLVLALMDVADIFLPLSKMLHYANRNDLSDLVFISFGIIWCVTRHFIYTMLIFSWWFESPYYIEFAWQPSNCDECGAVAYYSFIFFLCVHQVLLAWWFQKIVMSIWYRSLQDRVAKWNAYVRGSSTTHTDSPAEVVGTSQRSNDNTQQKHRRRELLKEVQLQVSAAIKEIVGLSTLDLKTPLRDLGMTSLSVFELKDRLSKTFNLELPITVMFECPTAEALVAYIEKAISDPQKESAPVPAPGISSVLPTVDHKTTVLAAPRKQPLAVVGMGCRFSGNSTDAKKFWDFLYNGGNGVIPVPKERFDMSAFYDPEGQGKVGRAYMHNIGYIENAKLFDAQFFGVSPREAHAIDPQQRLFLETTWEALENANLPHAALKDRSVGVFMGCCSNEYFSKISDMDIKFVEGYLSTGTSPACLAGRVSYTFGFNGPAISVDTACSSSLVAMHLAKNSIHNNESNICVVGGACLVLEYSSIVALCQMRMLSPSGRCATFDDGANGYVRGDGIAVAIVMPLNQAISENKKIYAVVKGSAVNQDGRSASLTSPSVSAQVSVYREALRDAELTGKDITMLEAHGTGTALGDPIEVSSLSTVYGRTPSCLPEGIVTLKQFPSDIKTAPTVNPFEGNFAYLGSVKTNIGHTEGAAGIAGIFKVILAMNNEIVPPHLHFTKQNHNFAAPLHSLGFVIPTKPMPWPRVAGKIRRGAVSSFGFSGTNGHVILEEAPLIEKPVVPLPRPLVDTFLFTVSAKTKAALTEQAKQYADFVETKYAPLMGKTDEAAKRALSDLAYSVTNFRTHFNHRVAIPFSDIATLVKNLRAVQAGEAVKAQSQLSPKTSQLPELVYGNIKQLEAAPNVLFLFTGQGSQYVGMAAELFKSHIAFREAFLQVQQEFLACSGPDVRALLYNEAKDDENHPIHDTVNTQPVLFAIEYALARVWMNIGVQPNMLIGHSIGEIVAATISGVFSLRAAVKLVTARSSLMGDIEKKQKKKNIEGAMVAVYCTEQETRDVIVALENAASDKVAAHVDIAAVNGPRMIVISGRAPAVAAVQKECEKKYGCQTKVLKVSNGFHSSLLDPMLDEFARIAKAIEFGSVNIPFVSNVTGKIATNALVCNSEYWVNHVRGTVRFNDGIITAYESGARIFVEIGPHPVLVTMASQLLQVFKPSPAAANSSSLNDEVMYIPTLKRNQFPETQMLACSLAHLYAHGILDRLVEFDHMDVKDALSNFMPRDGATLPYPPLELPLYPFQRQAFWIEEDEEWVNPLTIQKQAAAVGQAAGQGRHPILGFAQPVAITEDDKSIRSRIVLPANVDLSTAHHSFFADHVVMKNILIPAAGFLEIALGAAAEVSGVMRCPVSIEKFSVSDPAVMISQKDTRTMQIVLANTPAVGSYDFEIMGQSKSSPWIRHAKGELHILPLDLKAQIDTATQWNHMKNDIMSEKQMDISKFYETMARETGLQYGPRFQGVTKLWRSGTEAVGVVSFAAVSKEKSSRFSSLGWRFYPALLDSCFHVASATITREQRQEMKGGVFLPVRVDSLVQYAPHDVDTAPELTVFASQKTAGSGIISTNFVIYAGEGRVMATISGFTVARVAKTELAARLKEAVAAAAGADNAPVSPVYEIVYKPYAPEPMPANVPTKPLVLVLAEDDYYTGPSFSRVLVQSMNEIMNKSKSKVSLPSAMKEAVASARAKSRASTPAGTPAKPVAGATPQTNMFTPKRSVPPTSLMSPMPMGALDDAPVVSLDADVWTIAHHHRFFVDEKERVVHISARNQDGYKNLCELPFITNAQDIVIIVAKPMGGANSSVNFTLELAAFFKAFVQRKKMPNVVVTYLTRGMINNNVKMNVDAAATQAAGLGLMRSIANEYASFKLLAMDLDGSVIDAQPSKKTMYQEIESRAILSEITSRYLGTSKKGNAELSLKFAADDLLMSSMSIIPSPKLAPGSSDKHAPWTPKTDATYLISGATGAVGVQVARWLLQLGARSLLLMDVKEPTGVAKTTIEALKKAFPNAIVTMVANVDVRDYEQLHLAVSDALTNLPPLAGIFHAAGLLHDAVFMDQTPETLKKVLEPKLLGAYNFHMLSLSELPFKLAERKTRAVPSLDCFVLFSSVAGVFGNPSQSNYAAANAYLDALARARQARKLPGLSVNFGPWGGSGMAARANLEQMLQAQGVRLNSPEICLKWMGWGIAHRDLPQIAVADVDWNVFLAQMKPSDTVADLKASLKPVAAPDVDIIDSDSDEEEVVTKKKKKPAKAAKSQGILIELKKMEPAAQKARVASMVVNEIKAVLGTAGELDSSTPLTELGVDSIMGMEVVNRFKEAFKANIPPTLLMQNPTVDGIVDYVIVNHINTAVEAAPEAEEEPEEKVEKHDEKKNTETAMVKAAPKTVGLPGYSKPETYTSLNDRMTNFFNMRKQMDLRIFITVDSYQAGSRIKVHELEKENQWVVNMSDYSYMGLYQNERVIAAMKKAVDDFGTGAHGTPVRMAAVNTYNIKLADIICEIYGKEDCLISTTGYTANMSVVGGMMGKGDIIFCDQLDHMSIVDAAKLSGAKVITYTHEDLGLLEKLADESMRVAPDASKLIIVDGVYSMDGEITKFDQVRRIANKINALLMIDEAHALGAIGEFGRGTQDVYHMIGAADIVTGGLGKGAASSGGYIATTKQITRYLKDHANNYLHSGGMLAHQAAAAHQTLSLLREIRKDENGKEYSWVMKNVRDNMDTLRRKLQSYNISFIDDGAPCMPVMVYNDRACLKLASQLLQHGYFVAPSIYPAVKIGKERLRVCVNGGLRREDIEDFVDTMVKVAAELGIDSIYRKENPHAEDSKSNMQPQRNLAAGLESLGQYVKPSDYIDLPERLRRWDVKLESEAKPSYLTKVVISGYQQNNVMTVLDTFDEKKIHEWSQDPSKAVTKQITNMSDYSYLGLYKHPDIMAATKKAIDQYGTGNHGAPLQAGVSEEHRNLYTALSEHFGKQACLISTTGYTANLSAISGLMNPGDIAFIDDQVHACISDGAFLARAHTVRYKRGDLVQLESLLEQAPQGVTKMVIMDGLYGTDGELASLPEIRKLTKKYNTLLMVDEGASFGVIGETGRGIGEVYNMIGEADIITGTVSKATGSAGGFIVASEEICGYLMYSGTNYMFSGGQLADKAAAALTAMKIIKNDQKPIQKMRKNMIQLVSALEDRHIRVITPLISSLRTQAAGPMIKIPILNRNKTERLGEAMYERGYYTAISLEPGKECLKLYASAALEKEQISKFVDVLESAARAVGVTEIFNKL